MSGLRRLGVFLSALWILAWALLYALESVFDPVGFTLFGLVPVALVWGVWWVVAGFRQRGT